MYQVSESLPVRMKPMSMWLDVAPEGVPQWVLDAFDQARNVVGITLTLGSGYTMTYRKAGTE